MSWHQQWAPYVPVAAKIARGHAAAKKLAAQEKRQPCPVRLAGLKFAKTFWGLKWCENLERYRDFANRLPRGATYVRNGSVADLVIEPGQIRAIVGGSQAYTIKIKIATLKPGAWKEILRDCSRGINSLFDLLQGKFSDGVMQRLTQADGGLFPRSDEITMSCSCPDYAGVCKHIAATFYGVAARLDSKPELLFKLRHVDHLELISHATSAANLHDALSSTAAATLSHGELGEIFGIDLEASAEPAPPTTKKRSGKRAKPVAAAPAAKVRRRDSLNPAASKSTAKKTTRTIAKKSAAKAPLAPIKSVTGKRTKKTVAAAPAAKRAVKSTAKSRELAQTSVSQRTARKQTTKRAATKKRPPSAPAS